ncbi:dTDP-4-dehydrorhamnose reductase [Castellaniella sp.]|uniref:dTDP-4-dehydrorhamnose reductase n=1 Tax=Castellaniella sp. TaxID=1955812 RepID=UPI00355EF4BB
MKLLLLGKDGQLGLALRQTLPALGAVRALGRTELDLAAGPKSAVGHARHDTQGGLHQLERFLQQVRPQIIVNAAACTAVDDAQHDIERAWQVNVQAPSCMAAWARRSDALLVHYSSDYVFDGCKRSPYLESDRAAPLNVYGQTKLAADQAILDSGCSCLIFRTSWVFSAQPGNFVHTVVMRALGCDALSVVDDQVGAPTPARLLAQVTVRAIEAWQRGGLTAGLYHLTAAGATSRHELACHIVRHMQARGVRTRLQPHCIRAVATADDPGRAVRPMNSRLDGAALQQALGSVWPHWSGLVDEVVDEILQNLGIV